MKRILMHALIVIALIAFAAAVWFAGPLIGIAGNYPFDPVWVRLLIIIPVFVIVAVVYLVRWLKARKAEKALEEAIAEPQVTGDGEALGEKMSEALDVLRRSSGSRSYLYDLPWYVIIGPPGAGKTTALLNSGIKFPLADKTGGAMPGAGGTRYCDWWFAEDAVLIDTAGRYTTQDSDAEADAESWMSFLRLLKEHRTRQPINGVIVAIGLDDILTATPESIEAHAAALRDRLMEIHEVLRIDVPVYVMFTKADLVAGFSEFFGSFSASRRQKVWGATFGMVDRGAATVQEFDTEFEALCKRLSEEVTDRMHEEPDAVARIAIFGFPAQFAMLRERLKAILEEVFSSSRYRVPATLRGFYFTSGTQEGTPIDQVLGAMERSFGGIAAGSGQSGMGKSYFLHDLLRKVIFAEAGLVSYDRKAARREAFLRYGTFGALTVGAIACIALWGVSFYNNRALISAAEAAAKQYETAAFNDLEAVEISDPDLTQVVRHLQMLREMPMGYADDTDRGRFLEGFGFSQRSAMRSAATAAYRDALEHMLRPRILLRIEERIVEDIANNDVISLYEALKVYMLLGGKAPAPDDEFVFWWIVTDWEQNLYRGGGPAGDLRRELATHLDTMLELSARRSAPGVRVDLNAALVDRAQQTLSTMNLEDHAYLLAKGASAPRDLDDFVVGFRAGPNADVVFETLDGRELTELTVPGVYTYRGFHELFLPQLAQVAEKLESEQWVFGDRGEILDVSGQLSRLGPAIMNRYAVDFVAAWNRMFDNLKLRPMTADSPNYSVLATASTRRLSPIVMLVEAVAQESQLTANFDQEGGFGAGIDQVAGLGDSAAARVVDDHVTRRISSQVTGINRVGFDIVNALRRQGGSGGAQRGGGGAEAQLPGANVEAQFARWHDVIEDDGQQRHIDTLMLNLQQIQTLLILAQSSPTQANQELNTQISQLRANASRMPEQIERLLQGAIDEFAGDAAGTTLATLNEKLNTEVTQVCERIVPDHYPFNAQSNRDLPMQEFARLFAPDGVFDRFFSQNLAAYADVEGNEWTWRTDTSLGDRLSTATLRQFQRAADIRDAYFPTGSSIPGFDITIRQTAMHPEVETALLEVDGQVITTQQTGSLPITIGWPAAGGGGSASLQLNPELRGRDSLLRVSPGPWALMRLINTGPPRRVSATAVETRLAVGGRYVSYNMNSDSQLNPFFLESLWEFRCPRGL
ncbi:MAG: type VI secretion system membrane subunit TssM [Rhodobacteraceae bacterium]|nr:type VI secretion system membrane subunit TssM [Paracoccaceae bacterium]